MTGAFDWLDDEQEELLGAYATAAADSVIKGTGEDDTPLNGDKADNKILGKGGEDSINGKGGDDTIIGGADNDFLRGGSGADTFVFRSGDDQDQIADFSIKQGDGLDLRKAGFGIEDLKDRDVGGDITDHDNDGAYLRESSSNGEPEVTFYFGNDENGFDSLTITGVSIKQLMKDIQAHPDHYDFFG
ncbi:hypothetical protein IHQ68_10170 [Chelatococcus sambhunathii]|uniref:Hemolysin-type calcium-binding repeat (2 copies) n=1 Tax=Chelatococcus sambhunathii TaxID=363953 RepID=A0ABU1DFS3_9HYPH|nr:hypothetical protein [Chelatococcus sambhunathii]MDR4306983.1 hypothetical protein [Chelatococcus sambhunathii]